MINPLFLEVAGGTLALGAFILLLILCRYLLDEEATKRGKRVALAIAVYMLGSAVYRSWVWLWRHQVNDGVSADWMLDWPIPAIGLATAMVGIFCMIRAFSLSRHPTWVWAGAIGVTVGGMTIFAVM